jgi:hypothetical protein
MSAVHSKSEWSQNSKGQMIESQTWESFTSPPSAPFGAKNIRRSHADGKFTLVCDIAPNQNDADGYSVEGSMSQEPIETHEKFTDIGDEDWKKWNLWKNNPNDDELSGWKPSEQSGPMGLLGRLYEKGVTDYLVPRAVVRIQRSEGTPPRLSRLGRIEAPAGSPTLPSGANWMLTGASGIRGEEPGKWINTYEYMSSGPAGWDRDIYG